MKLGMGDLRGISEGDRRGGGSLRLGTVEEIDTGRARVRVRLDEGILSAWIPWGTWAAGKLRVWSPPTAGEQCLVNAPSGEPHQGVAMGVAFSQGGNFPAPSSNPAHTLLQWEDGGYIRYELDTGKLWLHAPCGVWVEGALIATGDVMANGGAVSLTEHVHCGVEPGGGCSKSAEGGGDLPCG